MAQHGVEVRAHLLHAQLQQLGQLLGHAERLVLEGARQHVLLAGQLEAHAPQAPHALAQERLHLRPGVPVARALGADHPVPLRVEEVGLVRELQDGAARVQRGLHHLLLREVRRVPCVAPARSPTCAGGRGGACAGPAAAARRGRTAGTSGPRSGGRG